MRAIAVGVLALLAGCDGCFAPKLPCIPKTCATYQRNCGTLPEDDGCGRAIDCGECPEGQSCGAVLPNVCDLTPDSGTGWMGGGAAGGTTGATGGGVFGGGAGGGGGSGGAGGCGAPPPCQCGVFTDSCGNQHQCGTCMPGQQCVMNVCLSNAPDAGPPLTAPQLALAGVWPDHVDLAWTNPSPNVIGFALQRSVNMGPFMPVAGPPGVVTHFVDTGVMPATLVVYQVIAQDAFGASSLPSNEVAANVPAMRSAWLTAGADVAHTSANRFEDARPPGTLAWARTFDGGTVTSVTIDPPNAFVVVQDSSGASLVSLSTDGGTLWSHSFGPVDGISPPSVFDGLVLVNYARSMPGLGEVDAFGEGGPLDWSLTAPIFSSGLMPAPISTGDTVVANVAGSGFVQEINEGTGMPKAGVMLSPPDGWTPTLSASSLWVFSGPMIGQASVINLIPGQGYPGAPSMGVSDEWVAGYGEFMVAVANPMLIGFTSTQQVWTWPGAQPYVAPPAVDRGLVYAPTATTVEVHDLGGGSLQATLPTDGGLAFPPALAAGVVYVSSPTTVFAFDTTSRSLIWTTSPGGRLSIAQHTLYVSSGDTVRAYALTP